MSLLESSVFSQAFLSAKQLDHCDSLLYKVHFLFWSGLVYLL